MKIYREEKNTRENKTKLYIITYRMKMKYSERENGEKLYVEKYRMKNKYSERKNRRKYTSKYPK